MYVTIESFFCCYCDEVAETFLRLIDTIHRQVEIPNSARRLFRVRLRLAPSVGTPAQGQRPDAAVQTQIIESRILTL